MVAAGIWKRSEVDRIEASLYRKVMRVGNMISNKAILNTMTSIRLAGEVVNYLGLGPGESPYLKLLATELTDKRTQVHLATLPNLSGYSPE